MACKEGRCCAFKMLSRVSPQVSLGWVFCQLEVLRQRFPLIVQGILAELPESLDETYKRILKQIPWANRVYAHHLLQCLVVAVRPLSVVELAEVLAIDFSAEGETPMVDLKLRCEDKEQAVLSACSALIALVDDWGSRRVQFSRFSVKEIPHIGSPCRLNDEWLALLSFSPQACTYDYGQSLSWCPSPVTQQYA
jgi:hypothetical protein